MTGSINGLGGAGSFQLPISKTLQQSGKGAEEKSPQVQAPQDTNAEPKTTGSIDKSALARQAFASHLSNTAESSIEQKETPRGSLVDITV